MELPAATGGVGDIAYSVTDLPAGLSFDAATRTISGTPQAEGSPLYIYTGTDALGARSSSYNGASLRQRPHFAC